MAFLKTANAIISLKFNLNTSVNHFGRKAPLRKMCDPNILDTNISIKLTLAGRMYNVPFVVAQLCQARRVFSSSALPLAIDSAHFL